MCQGWGLLLHVGIHLEAQTTGPVLGCTCPIREGHSWGIEIGLALALPSVPSA